jgi:oligopeptide transport system ATP-binding protein
MRRLFALSSSKHILEINELVKHFPITEGIIFQKMIGAVRAVDGVSFYVKKGETLGLVGESGCGKTTTAKLILKLLPATAGSIYYHGQDIYRYSRRQMLDYRQKLQLVFQDPYSSLNPRLTVFDIIGEGLDIHNLAEGPEDKQNRILSLLDTVGLADFHMYRYPHEFSGGQRQRVGIARALAVNPEVIVCDEPVSALDVSIRAQILNLLQDLQEAFGLTYLFIAHDLSVIRHICDRVGVMYLGKLVEVATVDALFNDTRHPYTEALMSAVPIPDPSVKRERIILEGDVPTPVNPPSGCRFHPRCRYAKAVCKGEEPPLVDIGDEHYVACYFPESRPIW